MTVVMIDSKLCQRKEIFSFAKKYIYIYKCQRYKSSLHMKQIYNLGLGRAVALLQNVRSAVIQGRFPTHPHELYDEDD